jgi:Tfp pilus assembly pilus retraction ATPase PilT
MQMGQSETQMLTLNQSLAALVKQNKITYDEGYFRCADTDEFANLLQGIVRKGR